MSVQIFEFNPVRENTYVLYDETKECVIIDPGCYFRAEQKLLSDFIENNNLTVKHIINTHLHFDHIFGSHFVQEKYKLQTQANQADEFLIDTIAKQLEMFGFEQMDGNPSISKYLNEGDIVTFGNQSLLVLAVPGHSPGSVAFYNKEAKYVISGDALFKSSIGRTDLPLGNTSTLLKSIREKLLSLPPDTIVYPGHGPKTTIGDEINTNPFLR